MKISEVESYRKNKVRIRFDDGSGFVLYDKEAKKYGLCPNAEISAELYREICDTVLRKRARLRLLYLLQRSDYTTAVLRDKLTKDGYPEEIIADALAYVASYHYVDDYRYACEYIRTHQHRDSRLRMEAALREKGLESDLMETAFDEIYEDNEEELVRDFLQKKQFDPESADYAERNRMYQALVRRGFGYDVIDRFL